MAPGGAWDKAWAWDRTQVEHGRFASLEPASQEKGGTITRGPTHHFYKTGILDSVEAAGPHIHVPVSVFDTARRAIRWVRYRQ